MNQSPEKVLSYLAGNADLETIALADLQKLVDESPYFPVAQLLLTKKLKTENNDAYGFQLQKTVSYVSNPYWLHYQLNREQFSKRPEGFVEAETTEDETQQPVSINERATIQPEPETVAKTIQTENQPSETTTETDRFEKSFPGEERVASTSTSQNEQIIAGFGEKPEGASAIAATDTEDVPRAAETEVIEVEEEMAGVTHESDHATEKFLEEITPAKENAEEPPTAKAETAELEKRVFSNENSETGENVVQDEHDRMFQNIKAMLDATSEEADADTETAAVPIDPYYTIDYFASQGIKLQLDPNPDDQLGQHLKKFTQWLKHMKKLGPEDAAEAINRAEADEAHIQKIADSSNTVREVVTEAMAAVLEKQGKKDKAIELYNKLSFLNPDKNAYFAGKIKNLKGS
jgi:tetratricopeptide (TPR) repeat protein